MDYGHTERGQTNWAEILWGIWGISGQTINTILALWVPCPWESVAGSLSKKNFLGLNHITLKCSQNKILAVKNLGNSVHTSVFGVSVHLKWDKRIQVSFSFLHKTVCAAEKNTRMFVCSPLCCIFYLFLYREIQALFSGPLDDVLTVGTYYKLKTLQLALLYF